MSDYGPMGWKLAATSDAVEDDRYLHATSLGSVIQSCPTCGTPRPMACYRFAEGPFGLQKRLHLRCSACGSPWVVDKADEPRILASIKP
jgi:hypothetical protein